MFTCTFTRNRTFLALCSLLVEAGWFTEIHVGFLPVGHTHGEIDQWFSVISRRKRSRLCGLLSPVQWIDFLKGTGRSSSDLISGDVEVHVVWSVRALKDFFAAEGYVSMMKGFKYVRNFLFSARVSDVVKIYNVERPAARGVRSKVSMMFRGEIQAEAKWYGTGDDSSDPAVFPLLFVPQRAEQVPNFVVADAVCSSIKTSNKSLFKILNDQASSMYTMLGGNSSDPQPLKNCKTEWNVYMNTVESYAAGESVDEASRTLAELFDVGAEISNLRQRQLSAAAAFGAGQKATLRNGGERPPIEVPGQYANRSSASNRQRQDPYLVETGLNLYSWTHSFKAYNVICDFCGEAVVDQFSAADSEELTREFRLSPNLDCALCNSTVHLKCLTRLAGDRDTALTGQWWGRSAHKRLLNLAFLPSPTVWLVCAKCKPEYDRLMTDCCRGKPCEGLESGCSSDGRGAPSAINGNSSSESDARRVAEWMPRSTAKKVSKGPAKKKANRQTALLAQEAGSASESEIFDERGGRQSGGRSSKRSGRGGRGGKRGGGRGERGGRR